jgi:hypothetical protein
VGTASEQKGRYKWCGRDGRAVWGGTASPTSRAFLRIASVPGPVTPSNQGIYPWVKLFLNDLT